jgi:S1-C subfamily serine protease
VDATKRPTLDAAGVLQATRDSVVVVESLDRRRNVVAQGSGVIVANHTVVTAWPLISRAFAIRIRRGDDARPATVDAVASGPGLARLVTEARGSIELGRDAYPSPGRTVYAVGSTQGSEISLTEGIVSAMRDARAGEVEFIETTTSRSAGLTGGGLFDAHGELIGILASTQAGDAHGLALPVRYVKDLLALPAGTLPKVTISPLRRLAVADREWLIAFVAGIVRDGRPLTGLGLDRVNALLDRLDPLVGAELAWVKVELGFGWLAYQRLFWEDAVEALAFRRVVKSERRAEVEKDLLSLGVLKPREVTEADATMRAIAAHEPFDTAHARIDANESWLQQMLTQTDQTRRRLETQLWEARSR